MTTTWGSPQRRQSRTEAPGVRPAAHSVEEQADGAERQPEARGKHRLGFQDEDRHQSETEDGAPAEPAPGAEGDEQHGGHDERSPGRKREAGERRVSRRDRHARDRPEAHRRHAGDEPWSREAADRKPEPGGKPDVQARDREEMGGAGPAQGLALVSGDPVADPHHEGLDEGARRADPRELAKPPGERVADPSRVERAGGGQPPDPGVAGAHVSLARVTVPEQPGLIVEPARVAKPPRGSETDHEPPGLAGDEVRRVSAGVFVPRETKAPLSLREPALHVEVEPGAARGDGRNGGDPPRQDEVLALERGRETGSDGRVGVEQRPEEPGRAPAPRGGPGVPARGREEERGGQQRRRPEPGQHVEPVEGAGAEQEGDRP